MGRSEVEVVFSAVRRLRRGTLSPPDSPPTVRPALGRGLGYVCDKLAVWVEQVATDRRGADATIRFFGLGRLPEPLDAIAGTLRHRHGGRGLSPRQVQNLIDDVLKRLAADPNGFPLREGGCASPSELSDPCPPSAAPRHQRQFERVRLWAWADVPDGVRDASLALLHYEYEHGLRPTAPTPPSRTARQRWRRLSWSMLDVANYRLGEATASDPVLDRIIGPRSLAVVDHLDSDGLAALLQLAVAPGAGDPDEALRVARQATKLGRPEATELLGILRDAVVRLPSVRPAVTSKILALASILANQAHDRAGIPVALAELDYADALLERAGEGQRWAPANGAVASDALRTAQELVELYVSLGDYRAGWKTLRRMARALERFGDPEREEEPEGWRQQLLLTEASLSRHLARASRRPAHWRDLATAAANRSASLALDTGALPSSWGFAACNEGVGVLLDAAEAAATTGDNDQRGRLTAVARRKIDEVTAGWCAGPLSNRDDRGARLGTARLAWRLALLEGDRDEVRTAQAAAWSLVGDWARAQDLDKLEHLERATLGVGAAVGAHNPQPPP
jgi:hypothetical protein